MHDRNINVNASRARGLGEIGDVQGLERFMDHHGCLADLVKSRGLNWVEIKVQVIRPVHVDTGRIPLIQIDAAQVDNPQQGCQVLHDREIDNIP